MSTFENDDYRWRETYFVLFESEKRPSLEAVRRKLERLSSRFELANLSGDEDGNFDSVTLRSPDDYAALDISYMSGGEVLEQGEMLVQELKANHTDPSEKKQLARLAQCDARFDIMHFEQVSADAASDEGDEMLDPSTLLVALDALTELTGGIGVDPQAGELM